MKTTRYFDLVRERSDRRAILDEWIDRAANFPDYETRQSDGRIRRWKSIEEAAGRYLRVVLLPDGETVHNAFFDRRFKGGHS